ncbi:MAG TPA: nuclear transport factor 2 family protein [Candidatus Dormibacteraeota bacterium]|nr:nuclear transport factor 2 family protein [Candidatus Dormibacteraeota bacterium]
MASNRERNIEMARKGYQAFNEQHIDEAMATIHDEIVWHAGGDGPLAGEYKGKNAVAEFFMKFGQLTEGTSEFDIHDILASEDHTVVIGTATATRHGRTHTSRFVDVVHPAADGRAKEFWRFVEDQAADDEFLSE